MLDWESTWNTNPEKHDEWLQEDDNIKLWDSEKKKQLRIAESY